MIQLFLNASTDWQQVNGVVPGGLALPYYECTMNKFDELVSTGVIKGKNQQ